MQIKKFKKGLKITKMQEFAAVIMRGDDQMILRHLLALQCDDDFGGVQWQNALNKLANVINQKKPVFQLFALGGNSKQPFVSWSTLPGVTCPGAGDCLQFCYSYRAWRFPYAFARMVQNAYLMRFAPNVIADAFAAIAAKRPGGFDFRLYVDGDFSGGGDVAFWMNLISKTPNARAYGYSKSFHALLGFDAAGGVWPSNYKLNISSGHNSPGAVVDAVKKLPITRGEFVAVSIGRIVKSTDHGKPATNAAIRAQLPGVKVFPCPGACGACTGAGHACGLPQMQNRVIAIAIH